jgi:hypothetical protein
MKTLRLVFPLCFALVLALAAPLASAATINANSISSLQSAINAANPGDTIIMANGSYALSSSLSIARAGNSTSRIVIKAASVGGVTLSGTGGINFASPAAYVTFDGFVLTHSGSVNIPSSVHHIRITRCTIDLNIATGADVSYINVSGDDVEIDRNELKNKNTLGNMIDVTGSGSQVARRLWVHHNYFHDFTSPGGNGAETIRWGLSGLSMSDGDGLCEHNLFVRCNGENELISNKSGGNTYRYNTIIDSPGAQLTLRHGNDCQVYGNYFRNTDGLRVYGDRHLIHSNYFEGNTKGIDMGNGAGEVADGAELTTHDRPDDCIVVFNTFIDNNNHYQMGGRTNGLGATNVTIANNIFYGPGNAASISSTAPHTATWSGNILWNVTTAGNMPSSGYTIVNPLLAADANGVYHLQSGSPAINSAGGTYSGVTVDMDGQPRPSTGKDKGADEFTTAQGVAKLLTTADVGPNSGGTTPPAGTTITSADGFRNVALSSTQSGTFTMTVDATPSISPANHSVGLSSGAATGYTGIAAMIRFNTTGTIDARNGGGFTTGTMSFSAGTTYTLRFVVNVPARTYSAYARPAGGSEQTIGTNLAFRTEQAGVTSLSHATFNVNATPGGSLTYGTVSLSASGTPAKFAIAGSAVLASADDGNVPANTVDNNLTTRWSAQGDGQWIRYDLGTTRTISYVKIAFYSGDTRTSTFDVQTSSDGTTWTTRTSRTSSGTSTALETFDFADVSARYVRIVGHGNSVNLWNSYAEVEVWGF